MDHSILSSLMEETTKRYIRKKMEDEVFKTVSQGKILGRKPRGRKRKHSLGEFYM